MAVLAVGLLFAGIGSSFGLASLGFLVGSIIGQLLFPKSGPDVEGARLSDTQVTSSAYGAGINIVFGTVRVGGNIIWSKPLREQANKQKSGGKGGGGGSVTTYKYYWTGAVGVCEGPVGDILRIWADGKLQFDKTGNTGGATLPSKRDFKFTVYKGDEAQKTNSIMVADKGAGSTPAYRGLCYVFFNDIPVENYGNRIPNWTFEVAMDAPSNLTATGFTELTGVAATVTATTNFTADWSRERVFGTDNSGGPSAAGIRRYTLITLAEQAQANNTKAFPSNPTFIGSPFVGPDGYVFSNVGTGNSLPIKKIDPESLREVGSFGTVDSATNNTTTGFVALHNMAFMQCAGRYYMLCQGLTGDLGIISDGMSYVWGKDVDLTNDRASIVRGKWSATRAEAWTVGRHVAASNVGNALYRHAVSPNSDTGVLGDGSNPTVEFTLVKTIMPTDIDATWSHIWDVSGLFYSESDDSLIMFISGGTVTKKIAAYIVKYNCSGNSYTWITKLDATTFEPQYDPINAQSVVRGSFFSWFHATSSVSTVDLQNGEVVSTVSYASAFTTAGLGTRTGGWIFNSDRNVIVTRHATGPDIALVRLQRSDAGTQTLSSIVTNLCARGGLQESDIDVTALTDLVKGYVIAGQTQVRAAIEPLALTYFFDGVETDYILKFVKRGGSSVATLNQIDLAPLGGGMGDPYIRETRSQEVELPAQINVVFLDKSKDYEQNTQFTKRVANPIPVMWSKNQVSKSVALVFTPTEAKRISQKLLYTSWIERSALEFKSGWKFIGLDPADVVTVNLDNGTSYKVRLVDVDLGSDLALEFKSTLEDTATYSSVVEGDGGSYPQKKPPASSASKFFVLDTPLLRDQDDTGGAYSLLYVASAGYGQEGWPGSTMLKSADNLSWSDIASFSDETTWGSLSEVLGDTTAPFTTDETNQIVVTMVTNSDQLQSVTQLQMVNGANPAIIYNPSSGKSEIVQYRDVTQNDDGTFTLRGLLRGRRGTDVNTGIHQVGDLFIIPNTSDFVSVSLALGDVGVTRFYRGVPAGELIDDQLSISHVHNANALRPYAPVQPAATSGGSGITLTWVRRSRYGGELMDGTGDVPLGEASENYDIDIWNAGGTAVLRTLTSTTQSVLYTNANITTDFGTTPTTLIVSIFQRSAAVGRGFGYKTTIPVT